MSWTCRLRDVVAMWVTLLDQELVRVGETIMLQPMNCSMSDIPDVDLQWVVRRSYGWMDIYLDLNCMHHFSVLRQTPSTLRASAALSMDS